jgi:tetratricopeptide (TPR) repeat protein
MEAARRIDEWAYISERVPTTAEVLVATVDTIDAGSSAPTGPAVFELLDGRRNVARIVELTGLSNFQVCKVLSQLLDAGAVAPVATEELLPLAAECMNEGRLQDAISLYERAIDLGAGLPEAHSLRGEGLPGRREYEHAIYHLECEAEHRLAAGDRAGCRAAAVRGEAAGADRPAGARAPGRADARTGGVTVSPASIRWPRARSSSTC